MAPTYSTRWWTPRQSVSDDAEDFIVTEWMAALDDAGVPGDALHLIACACASVTGHPKGDSFRHGEHLTDAEDEGGIVVGVNKLAERNGESVVTRHRIAVLEDIDPGTEVEIAYLAAVLRHEIEHAKQRLVVDDAFDLFGLVDHVIELVCDGDLDRRRDLQDSQPIEVDAHAAGSAYVRRRYPNAIAKLMDGDDAYLVEPADPSGPSEELVARTVEFLHQFAPTVEAPSISTAPAASPTSSTIISRLVRLIDFRWNSEPKGSSRSWVLLCLRRGAARARASERCRGDSGTSLRRPGTPQTMLP